MTRPASPCPFYGMPCQYVPMAHRTDELEQENAKLRAALDILQTAMTAKKPIPMPFKKAINEARAALGVGT